MEYEEWVQREMINGHLPTTDSVDRWKSGVSFIYRASQFRPGTLQVCRGHRCEQLLHGSPGVTGYSLIITYAKAPSPNGLCYM